MSGAAAVTLLATLGWSTTASAADQPVGPQARVWVTTVDRSELLRERAPVTFRKGQSAEPTIVIDPWP
jgi:glucosylceramidase